MMKEGPSVIQKIQVYISSPNPCSSHKGEKQGCGLLALLFKKKGQFNTWLKWKINAHTTNKADVSPHFGFLYCWDWKEQPHISLGICLYAYFFTHNFIFFSLPSVSQRIQLTTLTVGAEPSTHLLRVYLGPSSTFLTLQEASPYWVTSH